MTVCSQSWRSQAPSFRGLAIASFSQDGGGQSFAGGTGLPVLLLAGCYFAEPDSLFIHQ